MAANQDIIDLILQDSAKRWAGVRAGIIQAGSTQSPSNVNAGQSFAASAVAQPYKATNFGVEPQPRDDRGWLAKSWDWLVDRIQRPLKGIESGVAYSLETDSSLAPKSGPLAPKFMQQMNDLGIGPGVDKAGHKTLAQAMGAGLSGKDNTARSRIYNETIDKWFGFTPEFLQGYKGLSQSYNQQLDTDSNWFNRNLGMRMPEQPLGRAIFSLGEQLALDPLMYVNPVSVVSGVSKGTRAAYNATFKSGEDIAKSQSIMDKLLEIDNMSDAVKSTVPRGGTNPMEIGRVPVKLPTVKTPVENIVAKETPTPVPQPYDPMRIGSVPVKLPTSPARSRQLISDEVAATRAAGDATVPNPIVRPKPRNPTPEGTRVSAATEAATIAPSKIDNVQMVNAYADMTRQQSARVGLGTYGSDRVGQMTAGVDRMADDWKEAQMAAGNVLEAKASPTAETSYMMAPHDVVRAISSGYSDVQMKSSGAVAKYKAIPVSSMVAGAAAALDDVERVLAVKAARAPYVPGQGAATRSLEETSVIDNIVDHAKAADNLNKTRNIDDATWRRYAHNVINNIDEIKAAVVRNEAMMANKNNLDIQTLNTQSTALIDNTVTGPNSSVASATATLKELDRQVASDGARINASEQATQAATANAAQTLADRGVTPQMQRDARMRARIADTRSKQGFTRAADDKVSQRLIDNYNDQVKSFESTLAQLDPEVQALLKYDPAINSSFNVWNAIKQRLAIFWQRATGSEVVLPKEIMRQQTTAGLAYTKAFVERDLNNYIKMGFTDEQTAAAFAAIQRGVKVEQSANSFAAWQALKPVADKVVDISGTADNSLSHVLASAPLGQINRIMKYNGIEHAFVDTANRLAEAKNILAKQQAQLAKKPSDMLRSAVEKQKAVVESLQKEGVLGQWRSWDVKNPTLFMAQMSSVIGDLVTRQVVAADLLRSFGKVSGTSVNKLEEAAKAGLVQVPRGAEDILTPFIPSNTLVTRDAAKAIADLENRLTKAFSYRNSKSQFGRLINDYYDPILNSFKTWSTVVAPGHHMRNAMGEAMINYLDNVRTTSYGNALRIFNSVGKAPKDALYILDNALGKETARISTASNSQFARVNTKTGTVALTEQGMYDLAQRNGLLTTYHMSEDLARETGLEATKSGLGKVENFLTNNRYVQMAGKVSEAQTHYFRMAHFDSLMRSDKFTKNFASVQDAAQAAVTRVNRYHPDPMGLSAFERRVLRRLIPFYSWQRQIIPVMGYSMMINPGRFLLPNKIGYAAAMGQGVDPNTISLTDQFPNNQLIPKFLRDDYVLGPVGGFAVNLGSPQESIAQLLQGNVGRNVMGMVSPILKAPIELSTGQNLGTGAFIADKGEYFDQMTPVVNRLSTTSGISFWGSVANTLTGNGDILDPQRAVQKGEKERFINTSTMNFLLGLGLQDVNRPSYQKLAFKGQ